MPLYDYVCKKCGGWFEVLQKESNHYEDKCPVCKGKLERQVPWVNFHIK